MPVQLAPVDPYVKLPAAVVAATLRATQMQKEAMETPIDAAPPAPPVAPAPPPPAAAPSPPPQPPAPEADLEHKLRSTEGRLQRAERERASLAQRLAALEAQRPVAQPQRAPEPEPQVAPLVTPEEIDEYGADFLTVVGKKAREELAAELFKVQRQINELRGSVGTVGQSVAINAREKMKGDLDEVMPQWRDINYDDKFMSWLGLPDPFSGVIRHDLLKSAYASNQTPRVLAFFKAYAAEEAAGSPPAPGNGAQPAPNGGTPPAKVTLESLAAPGRAGPVAPAPVPTDKPIITRQQITQFYADVAAGKYRGREAEKLENDAAIILAGNEGRIV